MPTNRRAFSKEVAKVIDDFPKDVVIPFTKGIALECLARIVRRTPIDTGLARWNWQLSVGAPARGILKGVTADRGRTGRGIGRFRTGFGQAVPSGAGADVVARERIKLAALKPFDVWYINNNLPYILRLEDGYSDQAPHGMVAVTLAELQAVLSS